MDDASCWFHKDFTITTETIRALLSVPVRVIRASGGEGEYQLRMTGIERKFRIGAEIIILEGCGFRGTVTATRQVTDLTK